MSNHFADRLARLEKSFTDLHDRFAALLESSPGIGAKEYLTTREFALVAGMATYTCREHCRNRRLNAIRAKSGRGPYAEFRLHVSEVDRYRREGLLPMHGFPSDNARGSVPSTSSKERN